MPHTRASILYAVNVKTLHLDNNPVGVPKSVPKGNQVQAINQSTTLIYLKR
jgi:hypothetical protein